MKNRSHRIPPPRTNPINRDLFKKQFFAGEYQKALSTIETLLRRQPLNSSLWLEQGTVHLYMEQWQKAYDSFLRAQSLGCDELNLYDGLTHSCFSLGKSSEMQNYGLHALEKRDEMISKIAIDLAPRRVFDRTNKERNIISFSLYGANSKYCETAVLNAQACPNVYPHWTCRFYVDETVPKHVTERMQAYGAQVIWVDTTDKQLPGTMWRFLALDDDTVDFVLFRDADSIISEREAEAVEAWIATDRHFHIMRDFGSHTELILAGMWGAAKGILPPLRPLMHEYIQKTTLHPTHADQYFLRNHVWPYVRHSVVQHDSYFSFMDAIPFPNGLATQSELQVGNDQAAGSFTGDINGADGSTFTWGLYDTTNTPNRLICAYEAVCQNKKFQVYLPRPYITAIRARTMEARLITKPKPD